MDYLGVGAWLTSTTALSKEHSSLSSVGTGPSCGRLLTSGLACRHGHVFHLCPESRDSAVAEETGLSMISCEVNVCFSERGGRFTGVAETLCDVRMLIFSTHI